MAKKENLAGPSEVTPRAGKSMVSPVADTRQWLRAVEASSHSMAITSAVGPDFPIEFVNSAFERMTGYRAADVLGHSARILERHDRAQAGLEHIKNALRDGSAADAVVRSYRKDNTFFWNHMFVAPVRDESGVITHVIVSQYDVTKTKDLEARLLYLATHDELTNLPNRTLLRDRLAHAIVSAVRVKQRVWVAFISIGRFKSINESLGHSAGDAFLRHISSRLNNAVRASDTIARWGGDEFVALMLGAAEAPLATAALERIINAVCEPIEHDGQEYVLTCSIGVASSPGDALDADGLLQAADTAAYAAKKEGHNRFRFFHPAATEVALTRLKLESQLRSALKNGQFLLHYQPQVDSSTGRIIGVEALVRWQHPTRGLIRPLEFIQIAEDCGLIVPLGALVLRAACEQNRLWQLAGLPRVRVAVNLSAAQFSRRDLSETIEKILQETGLQGEDLELELTESVVMENVEHGIDALRLLKSLGVSIAVDDFGTGYSSLAYLKRLPIDVLKIDRSFVSDLSDVDGDDAAIVNSIIALAHTLKMKVIAEGVETVEQLRFLQRHACDEIQGYFISRPLESSACTALLATGFVKNVAVAYECLPNHV